jgi:hypothetical protein
MATLGVYQKKHKVAIVGSGNWYVGGNPLTIDTTS